MASYLRINPDINRSILFSMEPEYFYDLANDEYFAPFYQETGFVNLYQQIMKNKIGFESLPIEDKIYYAAAFRDRELLKQLIDEYEKDFNPIPFQEELPFPHLVQAASGAAASGWDNYLSEVDLTNPDMAAKVVKESVKFGRTNYLYLLENLDEYTYIEAILEAINFKQPHILSTLLATYPYDGYKVSIDMLSNLKFPSFVYDKKDIEEIYRDELDRLAEEAGKSPMSNINIQDLNTVKIDYIVMLYALKNNVMFETPGDIDSNRYYGTPGVYKRPVPY